MLVWVHCPRCHSPTADQHGGVEGSEDWGALYICRTCRTTMRRPEDLPRQVRGVALGLLLVAVGVIVLAVAAERDLNTWLAAAGLVAAGPSAGC